MLEILAMVGGLAQERRPLSLVLEALCRLFEATVEGCFATVLLVDRTRARQTDGPCLPALTSNSFEPATHGPRSSTCAPILSLAGELVGILISSSHGANRHPPALPELLHQFSTVAGILIELTRNQAAIRRSEAQFAITQQLSSTGCFSWRPATGEMSCSAELHRIFELAPKPPLTIDLIRNRVHPDDAQIFREITQVDQTGGDLECEFRLQMPNHSIKHVRMLAQGMRDGVGQLEYIGAIQDVTSCRLTEETLDQARYEVAHLARVATLGSLTASIAHEINQPLAGIVINATTCLKMLAADPPDIKGARETACRTLRDGERASDVITRLRALFRRKSTFSESVDLSAVTQQAIVLASNEIQREGVILQVQLSKDLPPVAGDQVQLQQVVLNLLLNALDAMKGIMDRPRCLTIATERDAEGAVRLTVRDLGVGLPPDPEKLFQAFYTTKGNGLGIGLSISRSIIAAHRGRLWAESNDGPGATFSLCIPVASERGGRRPCSKIAATTRRILS